MDIEFHRNRITSFLRSTPREDPAPIPRWGVLVLEALGAILSDQEILDADVAALVTISTDLESEIASLKAVAPGLNFDGLHAVVARLRGDAPTAPAPVVEAPAADAPTASVDTSATAAEATTPAAAVTVPTVGDGSGDDPTPTAAATSA